LTTTQAGGLVVDGRMFATNAMAGFIDPFGFLGGEALAPPPRRRMKDTALVIASATFRTSGLAGSALAPGSESSHADAGRSRWDCPGVRS
jgi:hypothetical protein